MSAARPVAKKPAVRNARKPEVVPVPDPEPEPEPAVESSATDAEAVPEPAAEPAVESAPVESATTEPAAEPAATPTVGSDAAAARANAWAAPMNALGGFIRAQRQLAKLSLRDMATMTSVSNAYLSQVERGLHQPSLKVLHSIADALQLSTEQLLSQAGWVTHAAEHAGPTPGGTEEAIRTDPRLTPEQRTALLGVYRSFVDESA